MPGAVAWACLHENGGLAPATVTAGGKICYSSQCSKSASKMKFVNVCKEGFRFTDLSEAGSKLAECLRLRDLYPEVEHKGMAAKPLSEFTDTSVLITQVSGVDPSIVTMLSIKTKNDTLRCLTSRENQAAASLIDRSKHGEKWTIFGRALLSKYCPEKKAPTTMVHEYYPSCFDSLQILCGKFQNLRIMSDLQSKMGSDADALPPATRKGERGSSAAGARAPSGMGKKTRPAGAVNDGSPAGAAAASGAEMKEEAAYREDRDDTPPPPPLGNPPPPPPPGPPPSKTMSPLRWQAPRRDVRGIDAELESRVTESVVHDGDESEPAVIPPEEAAEMSAALTAGVPASGPAAGDEAEKIYVLRYSRNPVEFEDCLHRGRELEPMRFFMEYHGCKCRWAQTNIFVHPSRFMAAVEQVQGMELKPYHVIVSETYLPNVLQAVNGLRSRLDVRLKGDPLCVGMVNIPQGVDVVLLEADGMPLITVDKTFIDVPGNPWRHGTSVTQSTTEVTGRASGAVNPRRRAPPPPPASGRARSSNGNL